jgi:hypothetical protein
MSTPKPAPGPDKVLSKPTFTGASFCAQPEAQAKPKLRAIKERRKACMYKSPKIIVKF